MKQILCLELMLYAHLKYIPLKIQEKRRRSGGGGVDNKTTVETGGGRGNRLKNWVGVYSIQILRSGDFKRVGEGGGRSDNNIDRKRGNWSGLSKSLVVQSFGGWRPTNYKWRQSAHFISVYYSCSEYKKI